ncbi:PTS sugar transporter subunit IIA [Brachyspira hyodysenteriae]|uniref:PTS sugar transporter subunit IIA n=1 Tax=Brachyspira hyodysenteriae TaxID=159 RepID=UPI001F52C800|nr:PTS sugar transporter subunit IIA [Brachyspira hyodysenteriae]
MWNSNSVSNISSDEYTTNIGNGVAVPHGRIQGYGKTDIFVGFLKNEINYDSDSDEKSPVKLIFAILAVIVLSLIIIANH